MRVDKSTNYNFTNPAGWIKIKLEAKDKGLVSLCRTEFQTGKSIDQQHILLGSSEEVQFYLSSERSISPSGLAELSKNLFQYFNRGNGTSPEILFVDDEEATCKYFQRMFGETYAITTATTFDNAIALLERYAESIRLLVSDQRMPNHDGNELLAITRQRYPWIARAICTAYQDLNATIAAINDGGLQFFLSKPFEQDVWGNLLLKGVQKGRTNWAKLQLLRENMFNQQHDVLMHRITALRVAVLGIISFNSDFIEIYVRVAAQLGQHRSCYIDWSRTDYSMVVAQDAVRMGIFIRQIKEAFDKYGESVGILLGRGDYSSETITNHLPDLFKCELGVMHIKEPSVIVDVLLGDVGSETSKEQALWFMFVMVCAKEGLEPFLLPIDNGVVLRIIQLNRSTQTLASAIYALNGGA